MKKIIMRYVVILSVSILSMTFIAQTVLAFSADEVNKLKNFYNNGPSRVKHRSALDTANARYSRENTPTGYVYREFFIKEMKSGGGWGRGEIIPVFGFTNKWKYMKAENYPRAMKLGVLDGELRSTNFKKYYNQMEKACNRKVSAKGKVHVRSLTKNPQWQIKRTNDIPPIVWRILTFQCLAKGDRK